MSFKSFSSTISITSRNNIYFYALVRHFRFATRLLFEEMLYQKNKAWNKSINFLTPKLSHFWLDLYCVKAINYICKPWKKSLTNLPATLWFSILDPLHSGCGEWNIGFSGTTIFVYPPPSNISKTLPTDSVPLNIRWQTMYLINTSPEWEITSFTRSLSYRYFTLNPFLVKLRYTKVCQVNFKNERQTVHTPMERLILNYTVCSELCTGLRN